MNQSKTVQLTLRAPDELLEKISAASQCNYRSMNGEILARLERSFEVKNLGGQHDAA